MTDIVHMRNDVIEGITKNLQVRFEYKAEGGIVTNRTVTPTKFYSDFTGFTGYDTDRQEDRNFRFERVEKWKGVDFATQWDIEIFREGQRMEIYHVVATNEEEARKTFESGEYNFSYSDDFISDNDPEDCEIARIEKI